MENNTQNRPPQRKKLQPKDLLLIALAVLVMFRVDWGNMNSFHYLILFLLILCFMLRWSNMRKEAQRKEMMARRSEAEEAAKAPQNPPQLTGEAAPAVDADGETVPTEAPTEGAPTEEKSE